MKLILIILALFLIGAVTAYCSKRDYRFADGGKAIAEIITLITTPYVIGLEGLGGVRKGLYLKR